VNPRRAVRRLAALSAVATAAIFLTTAPAGTAGSAPGMVEAGDAFFRAALFDRAERAFRDALTYDAQSGPAHLGLARALATRREVDLALAEVDVAIGLPATPADAHLTLANLLEHTGHTASAAQSLDRYLNSVGRDAHPLRVQRARAQAALLHLAGHAPLRGGNRDGAGTIAFDIIQDKLFVKASINGRIPVDMMIDTGADGLVLSRQIVDRAGMPRVEGSAGAPMVALADRLDIAGLTVTRVPALVRPEPLRVTPYLDGSALSPLALGLSMILDYERRQLTLARRLPFEPADVELPLSFAALPVVVGTIGTDAISFVIDTGSEVTSLAGEVLDRLGPVPDARRIPMRVFDAWGARQRDAFLLTPGLDLAFGAITLSRYPVVVRSWPDVEAVHGFAMGGILGHNFLKQYRVSVDLVRRVVRLKRTAPQ
jgi:predicted aspartyl protease